MEGGKLAVVGLSCFREGMTGTHSLGRSVDAESKKRIVSDIQPPSSSALLDLMFLASKLGSECSSVLDIFGAGVSMVDARGSCKLTFVDSTVHAFAQATTSTPTTLSSSHKGEH